MYHGFKVIYDLKGKIVLMNVFYVDPLFNAQLKNTTETFSNRHSLIPLTCI